MHILFLTDNFPPEVNAPASRTFDHCKAWALDGNQVTVVTCAPNFPKGRVFAGYKNRLWQCDVVDGIRVIRVWSYITANEGFVKRILDYQSFMLSAVLASLFVKKVDVVVGTSPQFFTACAAWMVGKLKQVPWIFELRDMWPESIKAVGAMQDSVAIRWLEKIEMSLYRSADRIVSVTHSFKEGLIERGICGHKIDVVTNGVDSERFLSVSKDNALQAQLGLEGKFVAGYIGTHGLAHALETLLEAAAILQSMEKGKDIHFIFLGDGARKAALRKKAVTMKLRNVSFLDSVPKEEVSRYWSLLDVSITHLRNTELFATVIPSKIFECMGMGVPILHGVRGESADIVLREGVGEVFEPEDSQSLASGLLRLRSDTKAVTLYRANGPIAAKRYDRRSLAALMLESLRKAVSSSRREPASSLEASHQTTARPEERL